jgi:hypothetical protein
VERRRRAGDLSGDEEDDKVMGDTVFRFETPPASGVYRGLLEAVRVA